MGLFQHSLYSERYRWILICLFLIVGNKEHTSGNRDWHPALSWSILFSLDCFHSVFIAGHGCSGPVALAVLAAEWLFCCGRVKVFCLHHCNPASQGVPQGVGMVVNLLLSWLSKPFLATSPTFVCHSFVLPGSLLSVLAVGWQWCPSLPLAIHAVKQFLREWEWWLWLSGAFQDLRKVTRIVKEWSVASVPNIIAEVLQQLDYVIKKGLDDIAGMECFEISSRAVNWNHEHYCHPVPKDKSVITIRRSFF